MVDQALKHQGKFRNLAIFYHAKKNVLKTFTFSDVFSHLKTVDTFTPPPHRDNFRKGNTTVRKLFFSRLFLKAAMLNFLPITHFIP